MTGDPTLALWLHHGGSLDAAVISPSVTNETPLTGQSPPTFARCDARKFATPGRLQTAAVTSLMDETAKPYA